MSEEGKEFSSTQFSQYIFDETKNIVFLIGGPNGHTNNTKSKADQIISLSKMTFPHEMVHRQEDNSMPSVRIKENEPFDIALRRFKRSCEKAGILAKVRSCEFYEKPTWERKRKAAAAVKRNQKKVSRESRKFTRLY